MLRKRIVVHLEKGLEARVATEFVNIARLFSSDIEIVKEGRCIEAKSIMGVMCLSIRTGEEITLIADGIDEREAIESLKNYLVSKILIQN